MSLLRSCRLPGGAGARQEGFPFSVPIIRDFLDEPEVPLSPLRQLALLSLLRRAIKDGCQFVIATHSPILLALPEGAIWSCDVAPPERVAWGDLEHVTLTRSFLNNPENYLQRL